MMLKIHRQVKRSKIALGVFAEAHGGKAIKKGKGTLTCVLYRFYWCSSFYSEEFNTNYSKTVAETE